MNVLIIEDDADICYLYSIWLKEFDYDYVIARTVEEGLYAYHNSLKQNSADLNSFDLIVLDYDLPPKKDSSLSTKNGLYVAKEVLRLNRDQRIIFASAWPQKIFNEYMESLKCFIEILQKPFEKDLFIKMIQDTFVFDTLKKVVIDMRKNNVNPNEPTPESYVNLFELLWKLQKDTFDNPDN